MSAFITDLVIEGNKLRLRPIKQDDFELLYHVASDPDIWALHPARDRYKKEVFRDFFNSGIRSNMCFVIELLDSGKIIGSSRYNAADYENASIEIGWTFLGCDYWGGAVNAELKYLMITHAFGSFDKIHFCIGAENHRSIAAVKKLGAYLQPDIVDPDRSESVIYELTPDKYVGLTNYGKS